MNVVDASINKRIKNVLKNWAGTGREHRFWPVGRQWAKPNTLASG
jgi:hypothetical protein